MAEFDYEVVNGRKIRVRPQEVVSEIGYEILYQKVVEFECSQITEVEQ